MIDNKNFGNRIRELRQSLNLSLKDVADAIGVQKSTIGNIERGDKSPSIDMMITLADFFYVSLDYLTGRSNAPRYEELIDKTETDLLIEMVSETFTMPIFYYLPDVYKDLELRKQTYSIEERIKILFALREQMKEYYEDKEQSQKIIKSIEPTLTNEVKKRIRYSFQKVGLIGPTIYTVPSPEEREKNRQKNQRLYELLYGKLQKEYIEELKGRKSLFGTVRYSKKPNIDIENNGKKSDE